ncbi:MAG: hypothetical protein AB1730_16550 [Myxococcota bacterium]
MSHAPSASTDSPGTAAQLPDFFGGSDDGAVTLAPASQRTHSYSTDFGGGPSL